jgi:hypothetical protein
VFVEIDEQHLAGLQTPLGDDLFFRHGKHAHFGRHHHEIIVGDEIARRPQSVAVERRADLPAIGEGNRGRAVPRLHESGMVLIESAALLIHQRVAGPGLRNEHHHRMGERIAALHEEFERIVEAGGVGLALIGDRPELRNIIAEEL